jgi:hypothetical protein
MGTASMTSGAGTTLRVFCGSIAAPNSELNIISGKYQFNFSEPAMRSRFNFLHPRTQTNCGEALRQTDEPNFHLSSIELIDAAENG